MSLFLPASLPSSCSSTGRQEGVRAWLGAERWGAERGPAEVPLLLPASLPSSCSSTGQPGDA